MSDDLTLRFTHWRRLETGEPPAPSQAYRALTAKTSELPETAPGDPSVLRPRPTEKTPEQLDENENAQLVHAWTAGMHPVAQLADVLADPEPYFEGNEDILEHQYGAPIEWWDVTDASSREHRFTLVLWGTDCGALYEAGSTQMAAYISQFALWCSKDWRLWKALCLAHRSISEHYPESELACMYFAGSFKCAAGGCFGRATLWEDSDADEGLCRQCGQPVPARDD